MKRDYEDILKEMLPSNWMQMYDLNKVQDLKQVKNLLKKTFKRLGLVHEWGFLE